MLDVIRKFISEIFNHGTHWHCSGIAECADSTTLNTICHFIQHIEIARSALTMLNSMHHAI